MERSAGSAGAIMVEPFRVLWRTSTRSGTANGVGEGAMGGIGLVGRRDCTAVSGLCDAGMVLP